MYDINKLSQIELGRQGENKANTVEIDVSEWLAEFPSANISVLVMRNGDIAPYIASTSVIDGVLRWVITASDTEYSGRGKAEIRATVGDVIKKSAIAVTYVSASLEGEPSPEPPEPSQSWVDEVISAKESIENMSATADVDNNVGIPSVTVTKTIIDGHTNLNFDFKKLKGESGDVGNVDQHYNPTSEKAQSGIAVSEAVVPKADKTYVDEKLSDKADKANTYTKAETQEYVSGATTNFITKAVNDLTNYYLKSETYTRAEVQALIAQIQTAHFEVVQELPQTGESNVIYLVPRTTTELGNIYDEYVYITAGGVSAWEKIGSTDVDLTGYATEAWVNTQIANFLTQSQVETIVNTALTNYYTKTETDTLLDSKENNIRDITPYVDYTVDNQTNEVTITNLKSGVTPSSLIGRFKIPETITIDGVARTVTTIGGSCFYNCVNADFILPSTLTTIEDGTATSSLPAYAHGAFSNTKITNANPNPNMYVGEGAFYNCDYITSLHIPYGVTLGNACFLNCNNIRKVVIDEGFTNTGSNTFYQNTSLFELLLPETLTTIGNAAFFNTKLKTLYLPKSVTTITSNGFSGVVLTDLYFGGTETEFNAKTYKSIFSNMPGITIHYNQKPAIMQDIYDYHDSTKQNVTDNSLNTTVKNIVGAINEVDSIAKGANQAVSFASYSAMVTAVNAYDDDKYIAGQNIMIQTLEVPDLWVYSVESTSVTYTYTTDQAFITALETNGYVQVGYYKLSSLETQKVDLTDYYDKTETDDLLSDKLTEPSNGLAVGKYFRVASIDNDGHAVLECVDAPTAPVQSVSANGTALTPDANGNVDIPKPAYRVYGLVTKPTSAHASGVAIESSGFPELWVQNASNPSEYWQNSNIRNSMPHRNSGDRQPIVIGNMDYAVKLAMTDGMGATWTDAERLAALLRMGCTVDENGFVKWTATPSA